MEEWEWILGRILGCLGGGFGEENETEMMNEVKRNEAPGNAQHNNVSRRKVYHNGGFWETVKLFCLTGLWITCG